MTSLAGLAGVTGSTDGVGTAAKLFEPTSIAIDPAGIFAMIVSWRESSVVQCDMSYSDR